MTPTFSRLFALCAVGTSLAAAPASAAPWWYVGHDADRVVFVDSGSVEREGDMVRFSAKQIVRLTAGPVAMTVSFQRADCARALVGWVGIQRFGRDDAVIDTSTRPQAKLSPSTDPIDGAQLAFVCADAAARNAAGAFPLAVDDVAFTEALLGEERGELSPRALHDRLAASPGTVVIRSTAPDPATFGTEQTVKVGQPMVPPRDYGRGPQIPDPKDHDGIEVGRIYDVVYDGIKDGEVQFEIRGYSIDDLVHPGSGQTDTTRLGQSKINIRNLAITIRKASPDQISYSVVIEKTPGP